MRMSKTGRGLAEWAEAAFKAGWVYWYGTCAYKCTQNLLSRKTAQYPSHYGSNRQATYKRHIAEGRSCADCVGLIKGYAWDADDDIETRGDKYGSNGMPDKSASGMYKAAKIKGKIATLPEIPGALVWTKNQAHVAVYVGGGYVVELRGFSYGSQRNELSSRPFTHWGLCPYLEYTAQEVETAQKAAGTTAAQPTVNKPTTNEKKSGDTLREGDKGEAVKEMQRLLMAAGCKLEKYGADGHFGAETLEALKAYQTAHSLTPDGVCGPLTWKSLKGEKNASEGQETPDTGTPEKDTTESAARQVIRWGSKGEAVKEMQRLLMKAGIGLPDHGADGHYGAETMAALKAFQTANGLKADGICGPLTWAKLSKV